MDSMPVYFHKPSEATTMSPSGLTEKAHEQVCCLRSTRNAASAVRYREQHSVAEAKDLGAVL
jgi:hypothetical protein